MEMLPKKPTSDMTPRYLEHRKVRVDQPMKHGRGRHPKPFTDTGKAVKESA